MLGSTVYFGLLIRALNFFFLMYLDLSRLWGNLCAIFKSKDLAFFTKMTSVLFEASQLMVKPRVFNVLILLLLSTDCYRLNHRVLLMLRLTVFVRYVVLLKAFGLVYSVSKIVFIRMSDSFKLGALVVELKYHKQT